MLPEKIDKQVLTGKPIHNAWVRIDSEDAAIAIGFLAKENYAPARLDVPKLVLVIPWSSWSSLGQANEELENLGLSFWVNSKNPLNLLNIKGFCL